MEIQHIENEADYAAALKRLEKIFFSAPGTPEDVELDRLADLIVGYETARDGIDGSDHSDQGADPEKDPTRPRRVRA